MLSLGSAVQPADDRAVGEHRLEPDDLRAHAAVAQHPLAAGVGRDQAADGAESRAAKSTPKSSPRGRTRLLQRGNSHAGADRDLRRERVDRPIVAQPRRATARPRPSTGTPPPTSPVLPPCGHDRDAVRGAGARPLPRPRSVVAGRTTQRARPLNRPVQSVSYDAVRPGSVSTCCVADDAERRSSSRVTTGRAGAPSRACRERLRRRRARSRPTMSVSR